MQDFPFGDAQASKNDCRESGGLMKVSVDLAKCTGHARCNAVAPEVYQLDDDGYCVIKLAHVPVGLEGQAKEGADVCPERAIQVESDDDR
jgi:ferredoxin